MRKQIISSLIVIGLFGFALSVNAGFFDWLSDFFQQKPQQTFGGTVLYPSGGGTGWDSLKSGFILIGNGTSRIATSTGFSFDTTAGRLTVTFASSTAISGTNATFTNFVGALTGNADTASSDSTWTLHNNYPAACGAGQYTSALGDTLTCSTPTATEQFKGTLSTSTSPTLGNLSYWTSSGAWPETLGTIATTTLTGTAPIVFSNAISVIGGSASVISCTAASASVAGCLSSANWTTFNDKADLSSAMTGTFDGVDFGNGTLAQYALWVGGAAAIPSELTIGTGGYVLGVSGGAPAWLATTTFSGGLTYSAGNVTADLGTAIDISSETNLTAGRSLTLTGDDVLADDELYTKAITFKLVSTSTSAMSTSTNYTSFQVPVASTITNASGWCDGAATTSVSMQERTNPEITGSQIFGGDAIANLFNIGDNSATTTFRDSAIAANAYLVVALEGYLIGTPTRCFLNIKMTAND